MTNIFEVASSRITDTPGLNVSGSADSGNKDITLRLSPPIALAKYSNGGMLTVTLGNISSPFPPPEHDNNATIAHKPQINVTV